MRKAGYFGHEEHAQALLSSTTNKRGLREAIDRIAQKDCFDGFRARSESDDKNPSTTNLDIHL